VLHLEDRRWRVRGLARVTSYDLLRVNLLVARDGTDRFHVDTLDLFAARPRLAFAKAAATELQIAESVLRGDLGRVLLACEERADAIIRAAQTPTTPVITMTDAEEAVALDLLRDPKLIDRIAADVERVGIVGETTNALVAYVAAVSRKLEDPLAVLVQSSTAAGKSTLTDAVLSMVPPEDRIAFSAMTGQSLYYLRPDELAHRVLAIAEEEGAHRASYALKLLQSEGVLSIASTAKDTGSGRLITQRYEVCGPVAIFLWE